MSLETLTGLMAALISVILGLPQLVKTWRSRKVRDLSIYMWLLYTLGQGLWIIYGRLISDPFVTLTNSTTLIIGLTMVYLIIRYKN